MNNKGQSFSFVLLILVLLMLMLGGMFSCATFGCFPKYSSGSRMGLVTKLSEKGLIFKSWEGELLMALPIEVAGTVEPEKFCFNVDSKVVSDVQKALVTGKRVELIYRQYLIPPIKIDNRTVIEKVILK